MEQPPALPSTPAAALDKNVSSARSKKPSTKTKKKKTAKAVVASAAPSAPRGRIAGVLRRRCRPTLVPMHTESLKRTLFVRASPRLSKNASKALRQLYLLKTSAAATFFAHHRDTNLLNGTSLPKSAITAESVDSSASATAAIDVSRITGLATLNRAALAVFAYTRPVCKKKARLANPLHSLRDCFVFARCFDGGLLDMYEMRLVTASVTGIEDLPTPKSGLGVPPLVVFQGAWDSASCPLLNYFLDYFRASAPCSLPTGFPWVSAPSELTSEMTPHCAPGVRETDLTALQHCVVITRSATLVHLRVYTVRQSGQTVPGAVGRVELIEMGPRLDFIVSRVCAPSDDVWRVATRVSRSINKAGLLDRHTAAKALNDGNISLSQIARGFTKNMKRNTLGHKLGRVHKGRQDFSKLAPKRTKALRLLQRATRSSKKSGGDASAEKKTIKQSSRSKKQSV